MLGEVVRKEAQEKAERNLSLGDVVRKQHSKKQKEKNVMRGSEKVSV